MHRLMRPAGRTTGVIGAISLLALSGANPAQAEEWWQGAWAYDPAWCDQVENIGSVTPAPIAITKTRVLGYENSCMITETQELYGASAVHLRLSCQSEGDFHDEERLLMNTDETALSVWIWFGSGDPELFQRCQ